MRNFMTNYWLCITNEENWEIIIKHNLWGVKARNELRITQTAPGDCLVFYVKPRSIGGIFKVTSNSFKDETMVFHTYGTRIDEFQYRVKIIPITVLPERLNFQEIVEQLKFIKNKRKWWMHLMGRAMVKIPPADFELIKSLI